MSDQPMAKPACEHYWAYHCFGALSVRLCQACHEPDWDDVRGQREEAGRKGALAERERIRQVAVDVDAFYDAPCPDGDPDCIHQDTPFANLLQEDA